MLLPFCVLVLQLGHTVQDFLAKSKVKTIVSTWEYVAAQKIVNYLRKKTNKQQTFILNQNLFCVLNLPRKLMSTEYAFVLYLNGSIFNSNNLKGC